MPTLEPWSQSAELVAASLQVDQKAGLSSTEAAQRLATYGPNEIAAAGRGGPLRVFLRQFLDVMVALLAGAAVISALVGEWTDAGLIGVIVVANAVIGFAQEWRAEKALESLRKLSQPIARVRRDGQTRSIAATALVPGDIVELTAGDIAPADARLLQAVELEADESPLTGESLPVSKSTSAVPSATALPDRESMVYSGTPLVRGRGQALVTATGMQTEVGAIARLIDSAEVGRTPLQRRLASLSRWLALVVIGVSVVIFLIAMLRVPTAAWSRTLVSQLLLTAVSLAVAAIPEGLPAVITVTLALGSQRMAARNAIIRRLAAVETLGSVDVICSDKTGTLTQNRMSVRDVLSGDGETAREDLLISACLNSEAQLNSVGELHGSATERALLAACIDAGLPVRAIRESHQRLGEVPFSSDRKRMSTLYLFPDGRRQFLVKGAVEQVLELCRDPSATKRQAWIERADELARRGRRVLAFAARDWEGGESPEELRQGERDLELLGLMGLVDPPREEVQLAITRCREAGISPVMITGDHPGTAAAIAAEIGLAPDDAAALTGAALQELSDEQLQRVAGATAIYARVSPEHKLRIVQAHQSQGRTVAMTGDGVNDAPALKQADIGVAMGITGTEVSKEAAAMVLADDNFATIVAAVEEGRVVYDNIRKFVTYLLTANSSEVLVILIALLLGWPLPLLPVHLLWINLVTDGLPALALGFERSEPDVMRRPPRRRDESLFTRSAVRSILGIGLLMAMVCLVLFAMYRPASPAENSPAALELARTMAFYSLALSQLFYVLSVRSFRDSILRLGLWSNFRLSVAVLIGVVLQVLVVQWRPLSQYLHVSPLTLPQLTLATVCAMIPALVTEGLKWRRASTAGPNDVAADR
jgi:Ca2+-transporting ATPase